MTLPDLSPYLVPVALVVLVALPLSVLTTVLVAASSLGRALGAPARGSLPYWQYLRLLCGLEPRYRPDWQAFETLLTKVAHGEVRVWDTLGPAAPLPESLPVLPGNVPRPGDARRVFFRVMLPLGLALVLVAMISATLMASVQSPPRSDETYLQRVSQVLAPAETWVQAGPRSLQATVSASGLSSIEAAARAAGIDLACPPAGELAASAASTASGTPRTGQATGEVACIGGSPNAFSLVAFARGSDFLVVLEDISPPGLRP